MPDENGTVFTDSYGLLESAFCRRRRKPEVPSMVNESESISAVDRVETNASARVWIFGLPSARAMGRRTTRINADKTASRRAWPDP